MSEEDVIIKNKDLLNVLRQEKDLRDGNRGISEGHAINRSGSDDKSERVSDDFTPRDKAGQRRTQRREERINETDRFNERVQSGIRPINRESEHSTEDTSTDSRRAKVNFQLKNPFNFKETTKKPIKLFTIKETELEHDRLVEVYLRGSTLLDDLLEIVVKDHEPVQIWALDQSEAEMLAELHLSRAQVDENSARSARQLLSLYDRLYFYLLVGPRLVKTSKHIQEHHGVSFK